MNKHKCVCKFFDHTRGYGIFHLEGQKDVFLHISTVEKDGFQPDNISSGSIIECLIRKTPSGLAVDHILDLRDPEYI